MPALGTFPRLHSLRATTLAPWILDIVSASCFMALLPSQTSSPSTPALPFTASTHHFQRSTQPIDIIHTTQCLLLLPVDILRLFLCFPAGTRASHSMLVVDTTYHLCNTISRSLHKCQPVLVSLILPLIRLITQITDHHHQHKWRDFFPNRPACVCTHSAEPLQYRLWRQRKRQLLSCLDLKSSALLIATLRRRRPTTKWKCTGSHLLNLTQFIGTHPLQAPVSPSHLPITSSYLISPLRSPFNRRNLLGHNMSPHPCCPSLQIIPALLSPRATRNDSLIRKPPPSPNSS